MDYCIIDKEEVKIKGPNNIISLVLHTVEGLNKQVLIFNRSKSSAEKTAEDISKCITKVENKEYLEDISKKIEKTLVNPTKQCLRLAKLVKKGVAFHHSGLLSKQREIIEDSFKKGYIKVISSTPTLAAGLNLPAYKVIIKDYKRYSKRGMTNIPILEYHQMSGRAGRPGKEKEGRAVLCVNNDKEEEILVTNYIYGKPEEIVSKLAVEPILKMHLLSIISIGVVSTKKEIEKFFLNTFYAHQYKDKETLKYNLFRILEILKSYDFIKYDDGIYFATPIGKKINELYLNPDTGNYFLENIETLKNKFDTKYSINKNLFSLIFFLVDTLEMKPLFRVSKKEYDYIYKKAEENINDLVVPFDPYETDIENFLNGVKTTLVFLDWINEISEESITEKYNITPGELNFKLDTLNWLLTSLEEILHMKKALFLKNYLSRLKLRFKYGIKEELLNLVSLKNIGRSRARKLYENGIKDEKDIQKASIEYLSSLVGPKVAKKIKGYKVDEEENFENIDNFEQSEIINEETKTLLDYF